MSNLWAHLVSEHAGRFDPSMTPEELEAEHEHEHNGPGTIRNHPRESREWSPAKLAAVLEEIAVQDYLPTPCHMTHTEPFDFAQCETHDTTFPLGGTCKFNGREMWEVYAEEADEQRQLKVRAEMKLEYVALDAENLRGDMHHLIAPIIGSLRLAVHRGDWSMVEMHSEHTISRLSLALNLMDEAVVGTVVPDEDRGKHGVGLNHYPSLIDPNASPCIGAPHGDKK